MQARYYDPVIGRFLSNDPVGFGSGGPGYFNRYSYTANDPVNATDPTGMWIEDLVIGVPSLIVGGISAVGNIASGNHGAAAVDGAGMVADIAAIVTPGVPGGAGLGIQAGRQAARHADTIGDAVGARRASKPDFITNEDGVTMSTNRDINLVDTQTPTDRGGDWLQIHNTHTDARGGGAPHTHRPGPVSEGPSGSTSRGRETAPTTGADMTEADRRLRSGELRHRQNRQDRGGGVGLSQFLYASFGKIDGNETEGISTRPIVDKEQEARIISMFPQCENFREVLGPDGSPFEAYFDGKLVRPDDFKNLRNVISSTISELSRCADSIVFCYGECADIDKVYNLDDFISAVFLQLSGDPPELHLAYVR